MPRERIGNTDLEHPWSPQIGWSSDRSGDVQIGLTNASGRSLYWELLAGPSNSEHRDMRLERLTHEVVNARVGITSDVEHGRAILNALDALSPADGIWGSLSRHDINHLIKTLRRARDASFGRDE